MDFKKAIQLAIVFFFLSIPAYANNCVGAVGAAGNWSSAAAWTTCGGVAPTAADNVTVTGITTSITIDAGALARSVDFTGSTATVTFGSTGTLTIGDATAGTGNVALKLVSGLTMAPNASSLVTFVSTSATQQTVDFGGKTMGQVTFNSASNGDYAITTASTIANLLSLTKGTLHTDGATDNAALTHNISRFNSSNSNVRTLNLGASTIILSGTTTFTWTTATVTNLTLTAGTSVIRLTGAAASFSSGAKTYATVEFTGSGIAAMTGTATFGVLTRTGTAAKFDELTLAGNITVTTTCNFNGNSAANRLYVHSNTDGAARTVTNTSTTMNGQYLDVQDIALTVSWNATAITGLSGDCGNNTNITFTTPTTQTATGTASFNFSTHGWTTHAPLPQDSAVISNAFIAGRIATDDLPRTGGISMVGATGTPKLLFGPGGGKCKVFGSVTLISAMTVQNDVELQFCGRGSFNITSATQSFAVGGGSTSVTIAAPGGTYTLQDDMTVGSGVFGFFTLGDGTLDVHSHTLSVGVTDDFGGGTTKTLDLGTTGTLNVRGDNGVNNPVFRMSGGSVTITSRPGATMLFSNTTATAKNATFGGRSYGNHLSLTGGGAGAFQINETGNSFADLTVVGGTKSVILPGSGTTTLTNNTDLGNSTNVITFTASAGSTTLACATQISWDYLALTNIIGSGGTPFYANTHSTDNTGNTNWVFTAPPSSNTSAGFFGE